jgi:hypothetical protein
MGIFRATASNSPLKLSWTLAWVCVIHIFQTERELTPRAAGFNVDPPPITVAAKLGIMTTDSPTWDRIDLDALSAHNIIEHDASISRNDFGDGIGDNTHFNETTHLETHSSRIEMPYPHRPTVSSRDMDRPIDNG